MVRTLPTVQARGGSRPGALLPAATAVALTLACAPLSALFTDSGWLMVAVLTITAVCGVGGVLRALPVPLLVVPFAQTAAFLGLLTWVLVGGGADTDGPLDSLLAFRDLVTDGVAAVRDTVAPTPTTPQLLALLAVLVFLAALLAETLAVGLGMAGLSGAIVLLMAAVPLGINPDGRLPLLLVAPACGWLLILAADQAVRLNRAPAERIAGAGRGLLTAGGIAAAGLVCTSLAMGLLAPSASQTPWLRDWWNDVTAQQVDGSSIDPFVSVRSQLAGQSSEQMLSYTSSDGTPSYLALTTLETFDGTVWSPYPPAPSVGLDRPAPGAPAEGPTGPSLEIRAESLDNPYLPVPEDVATVDLPDAAGWGWDPRTGDAVSAGTPATGLEYTAVRTAGPPSQEALSSATSDSPSVSRIARALPPALPVEVADLAAEVTGGTRSNYERAVALQTWFTSGGDFTYSLNVPDPGDRDPLLAFLTDRVGFCQQYATAMAVMARTLGIPARVVVGFTGGSPAAGGGYVVTGANAHAWPELWFDGVGWVRFEPTPASAAAAVAPPPFAADQPTAAPTQPPAAQSEPSAEPQQPDGSQVPGASTPADGLRWSWLVPVALMAAAALALPHLLRGGLRRRRLHRAADGDSSAAWDEVRATAIDAGIAWPEHTTMRRQSGAVSAVLSVHPGPGSEPATEALGRLVAAAEQDRYAAPGPRRSVRAASVAFADEPSIVATDGGADVHRIIDSLDDLPRSPWRRVIPRSLLHRTPPA